MRAPISLLSITLLLAGCGLARPVTPTSTASLRVATSTLMGRTSALTPRR